MRNVPYYHEIIVVDERLKSLKSLLKEVDNRFNPYIINLSSLSDKNVQIVHEIAEYLSLKINDFNFPYPVYILGPYQNIVSKIKVFNAKKDIPNFYFTKEKRTTRIHTNISRLNISAEKTFDFNHQEQMVSEVSEYSRINKKIHFLTKENNRWNKLLRDLRKYDGE